MQAVPALLEQIECGKADLQMLGDRRLVESARRPRQLDLAMQRLVRDAKKRAVGHPQAKALGRNRAALHVDGDGAREVDALAFLREAQLPIAVVVGDDGARAEPLLQCVAAMSGDGAAASCSATWTSASAGIGTLGGTRSSRMWSWRR